MKTILIARAEISARFPKEKGGEPVNHTIDPGTPITDALAKKFGLTAEDLTALVDRGHVVERSAHVVNEGGGPSAAELAAAEKRATDAEAKVVGLEKQVADLTKAIEAATKPAAPVAGAARV